MSLYKTRNFTIVGKQCFKNNGRVEKSWYCSRVSSDTKSTSAKVEKTFNQPPLTEPFLDLPQIEYGIIKPRNQITKITRLPNGLRVASEPRFGQFCTVGVAINAGSRFEVVYPSGVSHFLEKLAFQSTKRYENKTAILKEFEKYGGICDCQATRDAIIYAASVVHSGLDSVVGIISETVLQPNITFEEISEAQQTIKYELENFKTKPEQDAVLMDMIHEAAYRDNTLGLPKICPEKNLYVIDKPILTTYLSNHYDPSRIVVAGVGVEHDELVDVVKTHFLKDPVWATQKELVTDKRYTPDSSVAQYTGGIVKEACDIPHFAGSSGLPELAHVVIGLEGVSYNDNDFIPMCVLNIMMGGGGSFSAGGPGKGMFTRLYLNVLNKYHWIFSATAYNHSYVDSGLFYIHVSATPEHVGSMTEVIVKEMTAMTGDFYVEELPRAKKQLQSMLLMNLETKPVIFEDIARQVLTNGYRKQPSVYMKLINEITIDDIRRIAYRLLASPVSVAARGNIAKLPSYEDIQAGLSKPVVSSNKRAYTVPT